MKMLLILATACWLSQTVIAASNAESRPNIVLVMADDQGWGDMAYNGHPTLKTPNFDRAAANGLRFNRFYAAAPVCSPTRASVLTGRHPNRMGVFKWGYPMRPQEITLAEALKEAGYATGHFGKWHLGSVRRDSPAHPGHNGFDEWLSAPNFFDNDPILSRRGQAVQLEGESSMVTVDAAMDWIGQQAAAEAPFFAVVWFGSPHVPHLAADEDRQRYADQPQQQAEFYGEITGMDRAFGELMEGLEAAGVRDNTILWYCSDNGALPKVGSSGGHRGKKADVYEGGLLVPSILQWPARIAQPRSVDVRCNTCDIYPTLLEIAGASLAEQPLLDGVSLVEILDGKATDELQRPQRSMGFWDYSPAKGIATPSLSLMTQLLEAQQKGNDLAPDATSLNAAELPNPPHAIGTYPGHAAWIAGDWKLHRIEAQSGTVMWELYDLESDRAETRDLSAIKAPRVARMRGALEEWLASVVHSLNGDDYASQ